MISKSVKAKRRRQTAEADRILDALFDSARFGETGHGTCRSMNVEAGIAMLPALAANLARFPRGKARADACWRLGGDSRIVDALWASTPERILEKAGLL